MPVADAGLHVFGGLAQLRPASADFTKSLLATPNHAPDLTVNYLFVGLLNLELLLYFSLHCSWVCHGVGWSMRPSGYEGIMKLYHLWWSQALARAAAWTLITDAIRRSSAATAPQAITLSLRHVCGKAVRTTKVMRRLAAGGRTLAQTHALHLSTLSAHAVHLRKDSRKNVAYE